MYIFLLVIIYLAFISLGLPDGSFGSAWPDIFTQMGVPASYAGIVTVLIYSGTVLSSLTASKIIKKFGTGKVTAFSALITSLSLIGMNFVPSFIWICLLSVPLGIGGGAVDVALNSYVSLHYKPKHMNWLHCFWGIGATAGPYIMAININSTGGWRQGYLTLGTCQAVLAVLMFLSLPLWNRINKEYKNAPDEEETNSDKKSISYRQLLSKPGVSHSIFAFFTYCGIEVVTGTWVSTYFVLEEGMDASTAAMFISLFYLGITVARGISGFLSIKLNNKTMITLGHMIMILGALCLLLPFDTNIIRIAGLVLLGLGCAPIYPSMISSTPERFGRENAQDIMGLQMAGAYVGSAVTAPLFGLIANYTGYKIFPYYLMLFVIATVSATLIINKKTAGKTL